MRVAVVGAGEMGAVHARAYAALSREGVELAGVFSRRLARAREVARPLRARAYDDFDAILGDDSIDAVDVTVPSGAHRAHVVRALRHEKHAFCETPLALTSADAAAMIREAGRHRRLLLTAGVMRFVSPNALVHDAVASRSLGPPRAVVARRLSRPYWTPDRPRPFRAYGDPLVELMVHDLDLANWLLGRPRRVRTIGAEGRRDAITHAAVRVEYDGAAAFVEGSAAMPAGWPFTTILHVACEDGGYDIVARFFGGPIPQTDFTMYDRKGGPRRVPFRGRDPYEAECRHFVRTVQRRADPALLDARNELAAILVAEAARRSWRERRTVSLRGR